MFFLAAAFILTVVFSQSFEFPELRMSRIGSACTEQPFFGPCNKHGPEMTLTQK